MEMGLLSGQAWSWHPPSRPRGAESNVLGERRCTELAKMADLSYCRGDRNTDGARLQNLAHFGVEGTFGGEKND